MKRLSLEELKTQNFGSIQMLESIKGGNTSSCHQEVSGGRVARKTTPSDRYQQ